MPNDDDRSVPGPYLKKTREQWLEKLLQAQKKIREYDLLPKELKELATNRLQKYKQKTKVQDIISYMHQKDLSDRFNTFVKYTNELDKKRSENLFDLVPEYKQYFL